MNSNHIRKTIFLHYIMIITFIITKVLCLKVFSSLTYLEQGFGGTFKINFLPVFEKQLMVWLICHN